MESIGERIRNLGTRSPRKLTLFACGCVRQIWDKLKDERCKQAVEIAETFRVTANRQIQAMRYKAYDGYKAATHYSDYYSAYAAYGTLFANNWSWARRVADCCIKASDDKNQALAQQHQLFDDIFGS